MPGRTRFDPRLDYYAVFDLPLTATAEQIQTAFRQRAKKIHPDRNPSAEATRQFQQLSEAYAILSDPVIRAEYDQARAAINIRAAFQTDMRDRTRRTGRKSNVESGYWQAVFRGLSRSPYRWLFVLLALVALANIGFILLSKAIPYSPLPTLTLAADDGSTTVPTVLSTNTTGDGCDPGVAITIPLNNALLTGSFEVTGQTERIGADYQLDWASLNEALGSSQRLDWHILSSGKTSATTDILADTTLTDTISRPAQIRLRLTVGNPSDPVPIQMCQIAVTLQ